MTKVSFLGLGIMGYSMAKHLKNKGYNLSVWNKSFNKAQKFVSENDAFTSEDISEVVQDSDFIFMCLGDDKSVEDVMNEVIMYAGQGAVIVDHTTTSADLARTLYDLCLQKGLYFLDAPVTGGSNGAQNGTLTIMCGGDKEVFEKTRQVMQSYGDKIEYFGKAGQGQTCKMVNQICIAGLLQALSEAVNFAQKAGLDTEKLFNTINAGAGSSWQMNNRINWMLQKQYQENEGFPVEWMIKDLNICLEEAKNIGADLKITSEVNELYKQIAKKISPRIDTSSLVLLLK